MREKDCNLKTKQNRGKKKEKDSVQYKSKRKKRGKKDTKTKQNKTRQDKTKKIKQNKTRQNKTKQNRTKPIKIGKGDKRLGNKEPNLKYSENM